MTIPTLSDLSRVRYPFQSQKVSGAKVESVPRFLAQGTPVSLVGGTLQLVKLLEPLRKGESYSSITLMAGGTGLTGGTHQWATLINQADMKTLRSSTDYTNAAWAANAPKQFDLSSAYVPPDDIEAYVGILVSGTTPPNLRCHTSVSQMTGLTPILCGTSTALGAVGPVADATVVAAPTASSFMFWASVA